MSPLYTPEELLSRPIEHTVECLTCRELGLIIACSRDTASQIIRGERDLEPWEAERIRRWLAQKVGAPSTVLEVCGARS
jgi:hypothetical protein